MTHIDLRKPLTPCELGPGSNLAVIDFALPLLGFRQ